MRMIADTSALRATLLTDYLAASKANEIVVPQLVFCECLQGDGVVNARKSLGAIAAYCDQVYVLKSDSHLLSVWPRAEGFQSRLIDAELTNALRENLPLNLAEQGYDRGIVDRMIRHDESGAKYVLQFYSSLAGRAKDQMLNFRSSLSTAELKAIGSTDVIPHSLMGRIERMVMSTTAHATKAAGIDVRQVSYLDAVYSVAFRFSAAASAAAVDWAASGGLDDRTESSMANDLRDIHHIAYATCFDGILSRDKRLQRVERRARYIVAKLEERYLRDSGLV